MGQEVLDAFWKSNDRIYNENTLLYHRLARVALQTSCENFSNNLQKRNGA